MGDFAQVSRRDAAADETARANRRWWDDEAGDYYAEHGGFLGDAALVWGPEGWSEEDLRLLGPAGSLADILALEVGAGAAQGSRWLQGQGARVVASDLSAGMLRQGAAVDRALGGPPVPLVQADAVTLPFGDAAFDLVFTAYGAVPFVADSAALVAEAARVLRPGGRFVFSCTHPVRWAFPDDPGEFGLTAISSYFDRTPYVEADPSGRTTYVEHHRTLGDRVRDITAAGLRLLDLVEPEWPEDNSEEWGGWSPLRGRIIPGTAIFVCRKD